MILIDETKLTNGTIIQIGFDLGIEGSNPDDWYAGDIKAMDDYIDKVVDELYIDVLQEETPISENEMKISLS